MIRVGVLTLSDRGAAGKREDKSYEEIKKVLEENDFRIEEYDLLPDDETLIQQYLKTYVDEKHLDLILTTGGTGVSPRDITPEATRAVLHKEIPGIAEAMRRTSAESTPHAMISRSVAGIRDRSLIVNLPGSPRGARENLLAILPALPHAIAKIQGDESECGT